MGNENHGHRSRLKERFLKSGFDDFEPHNMIELLLFYAIPRRDTNPIAHALMNRFGSLSGVLNAPIEELVKVDGIGTHAATLIKVAAGLVRPYMDCANSDGVILDTSTKICEFMIPKYIGRSIETSYLLCLDSKRKLLYCGILTEGTIDSVPIFTRQIAEVSLRVGATYVVLSHNHPSTFALPSAGDVQATLKLRSALKALSVDLIDHVIVSRDDAVSMADSGYLIEI